MLEHPQVRSMMQAAATWGEQPLKRHNDAGHPLYAISTLADFGLSLGDAGVAEITHKLTAHQSAEGAFQSPLMISSAYGGTDEVQWTWMACDAPTLLYTLLSFGLGDDERVQRAAHLMGCARRTAAGGRAGTEQVHEPGRELTLPDANVYALKTLSLLSNVRTALRYGGEMLLGHWEQRKERKYYLFGMGSDFRKLKYPFIWYDILHVTEVLSRFPFVHNDPRYREMLEAVTTQADVQGRYTAGSMYQSWKGWSFADKKQPSPWLTLLVERILKRNS
jgi:hypothetical protein